MRSHVIVCIEKPAIDAVCYDLDNALPFIQRTVYPTFGLFNNPYVERKVRLITW